MDKWNSKILLILAVAGGAIGIGNFLRFPTLFAQYGAWFLVPYFVSFFLLGLPLMLVEWTLGAYSRDKGENSLATMLKKVFPNHIWVKYLGILCVTCCLIIAGYYIYIESWMLGYSVISLKGTFNTLPAEKLGEFLGNYTTFKSGTELGVICLITLLITIFLNFYFVAKGVSKGVGNLIKWSMPILLIMSILMLVKVLFTPGIGEGIKYMYRGEPSDLLNTKMWIDAASQMFFSLSVGFTSTYVYVTYSKNNLNIFSDGLTSSFMNMGIEVILASFIAIPVSFLAFGDKMDEVAHSSSIAFGMVSMPAIFQNIPGCSFWCFLWFLLLFLAALTSSVSMVQVFVSYLCNKLKISGVKSAWLNFLLFAVVAFTAVKLNGAIDELDFWTNSIFMPIGALILISVVHALRGNFVKKFNENSKTKMPNSILFIIKYVTPIYLLLAIIPFVITSGKDVLFGNEITVEQWFCRGLIVVMMIIYGMILGKKD